MCSLLRRRQTLCTMLRRCVSAKTGPRRVSCLQSRAETSSNRTTVCKSLLYAKREHITGDSAKKHTTGVVPTEARVWYLS